MHMSEPSMINRSASQRAETLRGNLQGLRDVDTLLAEANVLKRDAAAEAEKLVAEAQALATDLLGEAEGRATALVNDARHAAEVSQARLDSVLGEFESGVRELGSHLEGALRSLDTLARALEGLRAGSQPTASAPFQATAALGSSSQTSSQERTGQSPARTFYETGSGVDDTGTRPLGWLFRATSQG
jgi:cell division septum initiation protein DivIVA